MEICNFYFLFCCGGLEVIESHKPIGRGTVSRFGFVGIDVVFLEEVCHGEGRSHRFKIPQSKSTPC